MPWKETCAVDERMRFVLSVAAGEESFSYWCRVFGISRKTGYKWLARYGAEGVSGLGDRSRRPHHCPHELAERLASACLAVRRRHPRWGPRKVGKWLRLKEPGTAWPAASTIGGLFDREGLTVKRRRRRVPAWTAPFAGTTAANDTWTIDFKGWFRTGDGRRCEPLTLSDAHSCFLLRCQLLGRCDFGHVWPVLEAALREYGLPWALRSDNGPPFASTAAGGLSRLAVRVLQAGVVPERIAPGHPEQNGRHERLHLTLKQETAMPPAKTPRAQATRFRQFQWIYNHERPHEALGQTPPAWHYAPSPRQWDGVLRSPELDAAVDKRHVRKDGSVKWEGRYLYINENLAGEWIGLEEIDEGVFLARYGPVPLGHLKRCVHRLLRLKPSRGLVDNAGAFSTIPPLQQPQQE